MQEASMLGRAPRRTMRSSRLNITALLLLSMVGLTACSSTTTDATSGPSPTTSTTTSPTSSGAPTSSPIPASWRRIATGPAYDYLDGAVWDGNEMLVVLTARDPVSICREVVAAYDPSTDTWRTLSRVPMPKGCFEGLDKPVWTGHELLLWGISNAAYDPTANTWRRLPRPAAGAGGPSVLVWTGKQMIGWGGGCCDQQLADGAAYTPATDSWKRLPSSPLSGRHAVGVWTGTELVIAGGVGYDAQSNFTHFADAAAYNPSTRTWRKLPSMPVERGGGYYTLDYAGAWDGTEMLLVGGTRTGSVAPLNRGVAYGPSTNKWRWIAPMAFPRDGFVSAWAGDQLVIWGGIGGNGAVPPHGESYDPTTNAWTALPMAPLRARVNAVAVWTGTQMLIWGGTDARTVDQNQVKILTDGAAFTPASA